MKLTAGAFQAVSEQFKKPGWEYLIQDLLRSRCERGSNIALKERKYLVKGMKYWRHFSIIKATEDGTD